MGEVIRYPQGLVQFSSSTERNRRTISSSSLITPDDDDILCAHTQPITLTLSSQLLSVNKLISIKDISGNASSNPITIVGQHDEQIEEEESYVINGDGIAIEVITDSEEFFLK